MAEATKRKAEKSSSISDELEKICVILEKFYDAYIKKNPAA
jgi:hypothetical protein